MKQLLLAHGYVEEENGLCKQFLLRLKYRKVAVSLPEEGDRVTVRLFTYYWEIGWVDDGLEEEIQSCSQLLEYENKHLKDYAPLTFYSFNECGLYVEEET